MNNPTNINEAVALAVRFERAKAILAEGYTFSQDKETGAVAACKPGSLAASYWINGLVDGCDCPDATQRGKGVCKHSLAWELLQEEMMWEAQCEEAEKMIEAAQYSEYRA